MADYLSDRLATIGLVKRGARAERRGGTDVVDKRVCMVRVVFAA